MQEVPCAGIRLADVSACRPGDRITVQGTVGNVWEPAGKRAPYTVILRDQSGTLEVVHWLEGPLGIAVGNLVECTGTIDLYRGQLQLRLWRKGDLQLLRSTGKYSTKE